MGFSVSSMEKPTIFTDKPVRQLSGSLIWQISGEGSQLKDYYLASIFRVNFISEGTNYHPDYKNSASGIGIIIGENILLNNEDWFQDLKLFTQNFRFGITRIDKEPKFAKRLSVLASQWGYSA